MAFQHIRPATGIKDPGVRTVLEDLIREVKKLIGQQGGDRVITQQEMVSTGLVKLDRTGVLYDPSQTEANAFNTADYSTPPAPTGVSVSSGLFYSNISWDAPTYHHHAYTEIWVSATDNISAGQLLTRAYGNAIAFALPSGIGTSGYVWVRHVSIEKVAGPFNATAGTAVSNADVTGIILMWSGAAGDIPTGWSVCDGTGGTPNLQDRVPIGAGSSYAVGATGGATTDVTTVPSSTVAVDNNADGSTVAVGDSTHTHTADILPPYFAVYFIIYTG